MDALLGLLKPLQALNGFLLKIGRYAAVAALVCMVVVILTQIVFRYLFNNALPWPDEAARFLMLWMTGLIAPSAYRRGGFVAIDMLEAALPGRLGAVLNLVLLAIGMAVLAMAIRLGFDHVASGWLFNSGSLALPLGLVGLAPVKLKLAWMYLSLLVGVILLTLVSLELILRQIVSLTEAAGRLAPIPETQLGEAE